MKKRVTTSIVIILLGIFLISFVSADIIINEQPKKLYNFGDVINIPMKVKLNSDIKDFLTINLICNGNEIEIYKEFLNLKAGEEKPLNPSIPLIKSIIGATGVCKVKASLGENFVLSNEFTLSNKIFLEIKTNETEFNPGENIIIQGTATKENGEFVNGFLDLQLNTENLESIKLSDTVNKGYFNINLSLPKDEKAGAHIININIYEKEGENVTNTGLLDYGISVNQIPTSLEIVFENKEIIPGTTLRVKGILHDQTGERIDSTNIITIKNQKNSILQQTELATDTFLEYSIKYNEPPAEWTVVSASNKLMAEANLKIKEKMDIDISVINQTLEIKNTGNVPYNKTLLIRIGNETRALDTILGVDKTQKYVLSAPDGEYAIEIIKDGKNVLSQSVFLTGNVISIKEASNTIVKIIRHPAVWIFIIAIMGFMGFMVFRKGYKRIFIGHIGFKKDKSFSLKKGSLLQSKNRAEMLLSIKGDRQEVSVICLKIKNLKEIQAEKSNAENIIQRIIEIAEENKAVIYENQENIFFIIAPAKTKTFKNEKTALDIAIKASEILTSYNKVARQKIKFGISLNYGAIVAKQEPDSFKFMSMGNLITEARKIASLSDEEILIGEKINAKLLSDAKTEKNEKGNTIYYTIKELRHQRDDKKFISNFVRKYEEENKNNKNQKTNSE